MNQASSSQRTSESAENARPSIVLITGGMGFIGSHLVDFLSCIGIQTRILDNLSNPRKGWTNSLSELHIADITNQDAVKKAVCGIDACVHLAAQPSVEVCELEPELTHEINVAGVEILANAVANEASIREKKIPFCFASSAAVYGIPSGECAIDERSNTEPISAYGRQKLEAEQILNRLSQHGGLGVFCLRFFNVFGVGQDPASPYSGVISKFMDCLDKDLPITINGTGHQVRDFVHVSDIVAAIHLALSCRTSSSLSILNIGSGVATSILNLAQFMNGALRNPMKVQHAPARTGDISFSLAEIERAKRVIEYSPQTDFQSGISALLREYLHDQTKLSSI